MTSGNPLEVRASVGSLSASYRESEASDGVDLIRVRRSNKERKMKMRSAASVYVAVNLDAEDRLKVGGKLRCKFALQIYVKDGPEIFILCTRTHAG